MPVLLDDDTAARLIHSLTRVPPVSGQLVLSAILTLSDRINTLQEKIDTMSQTNQTTDQQFQAEFAATLDAVRRQTSVVDGLKQAFTDLNGKLAAAIADAANKGATADELASLRALHASVDGNTDAITSAVTENTPAAAPASDSGNGAGGAGQAAA